ncbi:MAG: Hsp33 family molecular chaperone HslO [Caldicoprobacterales bacterium]|nr:Hsp33 family molecular chaperone HslO [Clostridiales bacterium]
MDYMVRGIAANGKLRAFAAVTTDLVAEAVRVHDLSPVAAAALGRVLTAAGMMAMDSKNDTDVLSVIVKGSGPLGSIVSVAAANGTLKGYVDQPRVDIPLNEDGKLDVGRAVGPEGKLTVIKDLGLKEPYVGQTNLVTGEIGDDLANYFMISEQQPSVVALGVLINPDWSVRAAGGYIIQPLPGADDEVIDKLEQKLAQVPAVSRLAADGNTPEEILHILLEDFDPKVLSKTPMQFKCDCNRERLERVVLSLGREELMDIIETEEKTELVCHYCNTRYEFTREELQTLLEKA